MSTLSYSDAFEMSYAFFEIEDYYFCGPKICAYLIASFFR